MCRPIPVVPGCKIVVVDLVTSDNLVDSVSVPIAEGGFLQLRGGHFQALPLFDGLSLLFHLRRERKARPYKHGMYITCHVVKTGTYEFRQCTLG